MTKLKLKAFTGVKYLGDRLRCQLACLGGNAPNRQTFHILLGFALQLVEEHFVYRDRQKGCGGTDTHYARLKIAHPGKSLLAESTSSLGLWRMRKVKSSCMLSRTISPQVAPQEVRVLPYCNEYGDVNRNKDWEVIRNRTENSGTKDDVEGEQGCNSIDIRNGMI